MKKLLWGRWLLIELLALLAFGTPALAQTSLSTTTCPGAGCTLEATSGAGTIGVQITGTWVGTIAFDQSNDDTNWAALDTYKSTAATTVINSTTTNGMYSASTNGSKRVRISFSAYTSGTAVVTVSFAQSNAVSNFLRRTLNAIGTPVFTGQASGVASGTCAAPSYSFTGNLNLGVGYLGANNAALCANGATIADWSPTRVLFAQPVLLAAGSTSAPSLASATRAGMGFAITSDGGFTLYDASTAFLALNTNNGLSAGISLGANSVLFGTSPGNPQVRLNGALGSISITSDGSTTNSADLGTSSKTVKTGYFGTSVVSPLFTVSTSSNTAYNAFLATNLSNGTSAFSLFKAVNDNSTLLQFGQVGSLNTTGGIYVADGSIIEGNGVGGLSLAASHASGTLRLYTGTTARLTIGTTGTSTFSGTVVSPIIQGSGTGTSVANVGANSCGTTAATIAGNQVSGVITVGATAGTQCRVTFTTAAPTARDCTVTDSTTTIATRATPVDTSNTDFLGAFVAGDKVTYQCTVR